MAWSDNPRESNISAVKTAPDLMRVELSAQCGIDQAVRSMHAPVLFFEEKCEGMSDVTSVIFSNSLLTSFAMDVTEEWCVPLESGLL